MSLISPQITEFAYASSSCCSLLQWLAIAWILFKKGEHLTWGGEGGVGGGPC